MRIQTLIFTTRFRQSPLELFPFFARAENLEAITPPHLHFRILGPHPIRVEEGAILEYQLRLHGLPVFWRTRIAHWDPPRAFQDVQERGPWACWEHLHSFEALEQGGTLMRDEVRLRPPLAFLGWLAWPLLRRQVEGIFSHREKVLRQLFGPAPEMA